MKKTMVKWTLAILAGIAFLLFLLLRSGEWRVVKSPFFSRSSYWDGVKLAYRGFFDPTIQDIRVTFNDETIYRPMIDINNNFGSFSKAVYEEKMEKGEFQFVGPRSFKVKGGESQIVIGIDKEKIHFPGPVFVEIEYRILFMNRVEKMNARY